MTVAVIKDNKGGGKTEVGRDRQTKTESIYLVMGRSQETLLLLVQFLERALCIITRRSGDSTSNSSPSCPTLKIHIPFIGKHYLHLYFLFLCLSIIYVFTPFTNRQRERGLLSRKSHTYFFKLLVTEGMHHGVVSSLSFSAQTAFIHRVAFLRGDIPSDNFSRLQSHSLGHYSWFSARVLALPVVGLV